MWAMTGSPGRQLVRYHGQVIGGRSARATEWSFARGRGRDAHKVPREPAASAVSREAGRGEGRTTGLSLAGKLRRREREVARKGAVSGRALGHVRSRRGFRGRPHMRNGPTTLLAPSQLYNRFYRAEIRVFCVFLPLFPFPLILLFFYFYYWNFYLLEYCFLSIYLSVSLSVYRISHFFNLPAYLSTSSPHSSFFLSK